MVKTLKSCLMALLALPTFAAANTASTPVFAGTWNVTTTGNTDYTCTKASPGDVSAFVWIVSQSANGAVSISVQGETSFPKLTGQWNADAKELVLSASALVGFAQRSSSWLKLTLNEKGELTGIRRVMQDTGGVGNSPCFADADVIAKKQ